MLSVAMISMNEEGAVARVIGEIRAALGDREHEIVIVDSSHDRTPQIAEALGARVIRQFPPRGYGFAMNRVLTECRGEVIVTLDCDGTYPACEIIPLADRVLSGECDIVNASRLGGKPETMPWPNYIGNWIFAVTGTLLLGVKSTDVHSGMRAYRRSVIDSVPCDPKGPALPVDLLLKPALLGFRVAEVFIPYGERIGHTTLQKWSSTLWTFRRLLRLFPLRFSKPATEAASLASLARVVGESGTVVPEPARETVVRRASYHR